MAYVLIFSKWLLPGDDAADDLNSALYVPKGSVAAGKSAKASGLAGGKLQLNALSRNHAPAVPYSAKTELLEGDVLPPSLLLPRKKLSTCHHVPTRTLPWPPFKAPGGVS